MEPPPSCLICLEDIKDQKATTPCGHIFHFDCLQTWTQKSKKCAYCRQDVCDLRRVKVTVTDVDDDETADVPTCLFCGGEMDLLSGSIVTCDHCTLYISHLSCLPEAQVNAYNRGKSLFCDACGRRMDRAMRRSASVYSLGCLFDDDEKEE